MWRIFEFVSSILGLIALIALVIICIFRTKILESIILSLAVMEEYKFVNTGTTAPVGVKAFTLPPLHDGCKINFKLPSLPPNWEETFNSQDKQIMFLNTVITGVLIMVGILAILYTICKKCCCISSVPRVCFPIYPVSNFLRGITCTDIFVEITNISTAKAVWAYFTTCAVHPSQLQITAYPTARDMAIIKICCIRQLPVDWQNIVLCDTSLNVIKLPVWGPLSIWTTDGLESIENYQPYQIRVFGRILDQIQPIEIKEDALWTAPPDYCLY